MVSAFTIVRLPLSRVRLLFAWTVNVPAVEPTRIERGAYETPAQVNPAFAGSEATGSVIVHVEPVGMPVTVTALDTPAFTDAVPDFVTSAPITHE